MTDGIDENILKDIAGLNPAPSVRLIEKETTNEGKTMLDFGATLATMLDNVPKTQKARRMKVKRKMKANKPTRLEFLRANLLIVHNPKQKRKIIKNIKRLSANLAK